jgi:hypothetical protein
VAGSDERARQVGDERGDARRLAGRLYERLGYRVVGSEPDEWKEMGPDGTISTHRAMCTILGKPLR